MYNNNKKYTESGFKAIQLEAVVDRSLPLQKLQRTFSKAIPVIMNIDQFLVVRLGDSYKPAAIIETSLCQNNPDYVEGPNEFYLAQCLRRIRDRDIQGQIAIGLAETLGIPCFFLVHDGLVVAETKEIIAATKVFVYPLSTGGDWSKLCPGSPKKGWKQLTPERYEAFLFWIKDQCLAKYSLAATAP